VLILAQCLLLLFDLCESTKLILVVQEGWVVEKGALVLKTWVEKITEGVVGGAAEWRLRKIGLCLQGRNTVLTLGWREGCCGVMNLNVCFSTERKRSKDYEFGPRTLGRTWGTRPVFTESGLGERVAG
jgi:hypothetical protein